MPRPSRIRTPLRQVRDAISSIEGKLVTQTELARRTGFSFVYINAIEVGARRAGSGIGGKLSALYGVDASSLNGSTARSLFGANLQEGIAAFLGCNPSQRNKVKRKVINSAIREASHDVLEIMLQSILTCGRLEFRK